MRDFLAQHWYGSLVALYILIGTVLGIATGPSFKEGRRPVTEAQLLDESRYTEQGLRRGRNAAKFWWIAGALVVGLGLVTGQFRLPL